MILETGLGLSQSPAWSPDGSTIAFVGMDAESRSGLFVVDAAGGQARKVIDLDGSTPLFLVAGRNPDRLPGDEQRPDRGNESTGYAAIAIVTVNDGVSTILRATPSMNRAPAWSPDGSAIAFILEEDVLPARLALMDPTAGTRGCWALPTGTTRRSPGSRRPRRGWWSGWWDSNPRPRAPKARALPLRYTPTCFVLTKRMCFASDAPKTSLHRSHVTTDTSTGRCRGPFASRQMRDPRPTFAG